MRLSSLNPAALLLGPIFQKEIRSAGRRRATYALRTLYAAALLGLVAIAFGGLRSSADIRGGVGRVQALQTLAPTMALFIIWFQFVALALAAPMLAGPAICDERRARTLATLLTTPLSAGQIIGGKLAARIVQIGILSLLAAPLLLAIRVFGGLDARIIFAATALSLSTACLGIAMGVLFSIWHRRATSAGVFALLTLILFIAAPSIVEGIRFYWMSRPGAVATFHQDVLVTCSPAQLAFLTESALYGVDPRSFSLPAPWLAAGSIDLGPAWAVNSVYNLLLTGLVAAFATLRLRGLMRREGGAEGAPAAEPDAGDPQSAPAPNTQSATPTPLSGAPAVPAKPRKRAPARAVRRIREVSDHPVLWREVRQATFGSRRKFLIALFCAVGGLLYLYLRWGLDEEGMHVSLAVAGALAIAVQSVFMTSGSIAGEREARTWEVLLTTPLPAAPIVLGKAVGVLRAQWFLPTLVFAHFLLAAAAFAVRPILLLHLALIWLGPLLLFIATGQLFSLIFRKGVTAAAWNLALGLFLWIGVWIVLGVFSWYADLAAGSYFDTLADAAFAINPVAMTVSATEAAIVSLRSEAHYTLASSGEGTISAATFTWAALGGFAAYAVLAAGVLTFAITRFARLSGRSS